MKIGIEKNFEESKTLYELFPENEDNLRKFNEIKSFLQIKKLVAGFFLSIGLVVHMMIYCFVTMIPRSQKMAKVLILEKKFKKMVQLDDCNFSFDPKYNDKLIAGIYLEYLESEDPPKCFCCLTNEPTVVIYEKCHHGGFCEDCFQKIKKDKKCPFCRKVSFFFN